MSEIKIGHNPSKEQLDELGVTGWPIWTKEASQFPWNYDASVNVRPVEVSAVLHAMGNSACVPGEFH